MNASSADSGLHELPTAPALTRADLVEVLRTEQILGEPLSPLPNDVETERVIVASILEGKVKREDLAPLEPKHFGSTLLGEVFEMGELSLVERSAEMQRRGYGWRANHEIADLYLEPVLSLQQLRQRADSIVELWRRRRLVCTLRAVQSAVCAGAMDFDSAVSELRGVVLETRA